MSFTGSAEVGHALQAANPGKPILMEFGNNTPVIVGASADLATAAAKLAKSGCSHAGQSCISAQRVYVHQQVKDAFVAALIGEVAALRLGPLSEDTDVGPLTPDMKVSCEEVFGPVLAVQPVADADEGIRLANDTRFGLQAGMFTGDLDAALHGALGLHFGGVTVNESPTFRADQQPYGGVRESGNTREGPAWAIREYVEGTVVIVHHG